jgi:hypothetical protein
MARSIPKPNYALLALLALALGSLLHYSTWTILRNHGSDLLWALFGILAFRAIWKNWTYTWVPILLALLWEFSEQRIPGATFDPIDTALYLLLLAPAFVSECIKYVKR